MLTDLGKDLLHDDELIGDKGEVGGKIKMAAVTLDIQLGTVEGEQIPQDRIIPVVHIGQQRLGLRLLLQNTLLDDLIYGRGRKRQSGFEAGLNSGEFIGTDLDDLVNGLLAGADHPYLALALAAQLFRQRLEVQEHIRVGTYILSDLIDHKQQTEVLGLAGNIGLDVPDQLGNGQLRGGLVRKPGQRIVLTHIQHFHQCGDNGLLIEGEGTAHFLPGFSLDSLEYALEFLGFSGLGNVVFHHGDLQIFAVEAQMVVEHLCKDPKNSGLVLVDEALNIDVEQDRFGFGTSSPIDLHKGSRIILEFLPEQLHGIGITDGTVLQDVGEHLQKVGFTASEEAGDPHTHICGRHIKGIAVVVKKGRKMLPKLLGDDILPNFLLDDFVFFLVDLDDTVDRAVDVIMEHMLYSHGHSP